MKYLPLIILLCLMACKSSKPPGEMAIPSGIGSIDTFPFEASIRALAIVNAKTVWWAGSNGLVGHTDNGGKSWETDTLLHEGKALHFRAISVTSSAVFVLSIESPALLFKSSDQGSNWKLVYQGLYIRHHH